MRIEYNLLAEVHRPSHKHDRSSLERGYLHNVPCSKAVSKQMRSSLASCLFGISIFSNGTHKNCLRACLLVAILLAPFSIMRSIGSCHFYWSIPTRIRPSREAMNYIRLRAQRPQTFHSLQIKHLNIEFSGSSWCGAPSVRSESRVSDQSIVYTSGSQLWNLTLLVIMYLNKRIRLYEPGETNNNSLVLLSLLGGLIHSGMLQQKPSLRIIIASWMLWMSIFLIRHLLGRI